MTLLTDRDATTTSRTPALTRGDALHAAPRGEPRQLNVGSGGDYRDGWINMDVERGVRADIYHDFLEFPWPIADASITNILFRHVAEHVPGAIIDGRDALVRVLDECYRIIAPHGRVTIIGPHWARHPQFTLGNPTHYRIISPWTFEHLDRSRAVQFRYAAHARFRVESARTTKRIPPLAHRFRIRGHGLTVHLRDRFLGRLIEWMPWEGEIILKPQARATEDAAGPCMAMPRRGPATGAPR